MMRYRIIFIVLTLFYTFDLSCQNIAGSLEAYLENKIEHAPGDSGSDFVLPTSEESEIWREIIREILSSNIEEAQSLASQVEYQIIDFTDNAVTPDQHFYILEEKSSSSKFWGTYAFRQYSNRDYLILQAPHSQFDSNTGLEAIYCFIRTQARALFLNGTHRCNHSQLSECSGTTSVCGASNSYPISDMAHNVNTIFQLTTEVLSKEIENSIFVQLHGFTKKDSDPYVIMSNGSREIPDKDYCVMLKNALLDEDNTLTFRIAHINTSWTRLIGFTNTQGRLINNSINPCTENANVNSGRFIHIEQERSKLRADEEGWSKMNNALIQVFTATLPIKDSKAELDFHISPNPASYTFKVMGEGIRSITLISMLGEELLKQSNEGSRNELHIDFPQVPNGSYLVKIQSEKGRTVRRILKTSL